MEVQDTSKNNYSKKNKIDYDDILRNMGMREVKGKLFWEKEKINSTSDENYISYDPEERRKKLKQPPNSAIYQNSYIHNKYFKNELKEQPEIQKPQNLIEYRNMLVRQIIERNRINQLKSRQMIFR